MCNIARNFKMLSGQSLIEDKEESDEHEELLWVKLDSELVRYCQDEATDSSSEPR